MKYKNRLIVPTLITSAFISTSINVHAAESESDKVHQESEVFNESQVSDKKMEESSVQQEEVLETESGNITENSTSIVPTEESDDISVDSKIESGEHQTNEVVKEESTVKVDDTSENAKSVETLTSTENASKNLENEMNEPQLEKDVPLEKEEVPDNETLLDSSETAPEAREEDSNLPQQENESAEENQKYIEEEDSEEHEEVKSVPNSDEDAKNSSQSDENNLDSNVLESEEMNPEDEKVIKDSLLDEESSAEKTSTENEIESEDSMDESAKDEEANPEKAVEEKVNKARSMAMMRIAETDLVSTTTNEPYKMARINKDNEGLKSPLTSDRTVSASGYIGNTYFVSSERSYLGDNYYFLRFDADEAMIGWIKADDVEAKSRSKDKTVTGKYVIAGKGDYIYSQPWGTSNQRLLSLDKIRGGEFEASKEAVVDGQSYVYGKVGKTSGWVLKNHLMKNDEAEPQTSGARKMARINENNQGLKSPITSKDSVSADRYVGSTYYVSSEGSYLGEKYYFLRFDADRAMIGWMNANDIQAQERSEDRTIKQNYVLVDNTDYIYQQPWGTSNQSVASLSNLKGASFNATKETTVGGNIYIYGSIDGKSGWVLKNKLMTVEDAAPQTSQTSKMARINKNNQGLKSPLTSDRSVSAENYVGNTYYVSSEGSYLGENYYFLRFDVNKAMIGWIKASDVKTANRSGDAAIDQTFYINNSSDRLFSQPWGTNDQVVSSLTNYQNESFKATKKVTVGNTDYYYGTLKGHSGWIKAGALSEYIVSTVKYDMSLDEAVDTQMSLRSKPQSWVSGGGWRDATRSEVERYINPANHTTDVWDYTYLDLNRAQNISTVELNNKLLANKGILHNQGTAFLQAANTHGVNEVYLISHALHETGNGQSTLAQGVRLDENGNISKNGKLYYNMYGIAAYDHNPVLEGARYAQRMGWDTPAKAVIGGAQFISSGYFNRGQNTLYAMRWNPANPGTYQYATDVNWAYATARNLKNYYDQLGIRGQYYTRYTF